MIHLDKLQLLLPMKGANAGTIFTDYSPYRRTVWRAGGSLPTTSTDYAPFTNYGSCGMFPYNSSGAPAHLRLNGIEIGAQPFTFQCWALIDSTDSVRYFIDTRYASQIATATTNNATGGFYLRYGGDENYGLVFGYGASATEIYSENYTVLNTSSPITWWHHFEVSRDENNVLRMFVNGHVAKETSNFTNNFTYTTCTIGGNTTVVSRSLAYMTDAALFVGVALHTADFTVANRRMTGYSANGHVMDDTGANAIRRVLAHSRQIPARCSETQSGSDGIFTFADLIDDEHYFVCFDDEAGNDYNALVVDNVTLV